MKTNKKAIETQRRIMDKKLKNWLQIRMEKPPPSGWLKAVRGALGISSRQLAQIIGVDMSAVIRMEKRESEGKITLEMLNRAAQAMDCKVVYALVPQDQYDSLEAVVDNRSRKAAKALLQKVEHSMRLEDQGSLESKTELEKLNQTLKEKMDPRIWGLIQTKEKRRTKAF
jgi:predicted DNA-binding mobile mystery protein A